ncbi:glutathione S-transferase family protein [uncultured Tenacibaculum sp.]|uniref:glutathione S-transferase family protein n=1 Tax=uncultured Tenacibaculum sp. TaxID=174713 RepID=UPI002605A0D5|nr:glutathione S-transferase family protein [uncultured Tenacibaculum sp.]
MAFDILKNKKMEEIKGLHLFHHPASNNALRVRLLLEEKQIPWQSHIVHLNKFEQFSPEFLRLNPQGSVPTLLHNGTPINGSENILKYLEAVFSKNSFTPFPTKETEMWEWVQASTRTHISSIVYYLYAQGFGRPARKDKLHFYKECNYEKYRFLVDKGYHMSLEEKEEALIINELQMQRLEDSLEGQDYILGDKISVADIAWAPNVMFLQYLNFDFSKYPKVVNWVEKIRRRPSYNTKSDMPKYMTPIVKFYFKMLLMKKSYLK